MKQLAMPRVRITSMLTCPNTACARVIYSPTIRRGEVWMKCNISEKQRRGACPAHWLNITLPTGARGMDIAAVVGRDAALAIVASIILPPWTVPADTVLAIPLVSELGKAVHVQIAARARDEHHLRYAPIAEVLHALQITQRPL